MLLMLANQDFIGNEYSLEGANSQNSKNKRTFEQSIKCHEQIYDVKC